MAWDDQFPSTSAFSGGSVVNTGLAGRVIGGLISRVRPAFDQLAEDVQADLVESISTQYPPASEPGTPAHRRTGGYIATIEQDVEQDGFTITASVSSDSLLSLWLERGTVKMAPRPHFGPCFERWRQVGQRITAALSQG